MIIQFKVKGLFKDLNAIEPDLKVQSFAGRAGWFEHVKGYHGFHNLNRTGEAEAAVLVAADKFSVLLHITVEWRGYFHQVSILNETGLFSKWMLNRTFISVQQKVASGFKDTKDHCTLLFGGNAFGDYKRPLIVHHSENPQALKGNSKRVLPAVWQSNRKAYLNLI
jgi:hypothetical protein